MSALYFPIASAFISILLIIVFFDKERMNNNETRIYTRMIGINIIETLNALCIIIIAKSIDTINIVYILDRLDFILITLWCSNLFRYVYVATNNDVNKKVLKLINILDICYVIILLIAKFEVINYDSIIDTSGLAPTIVGILCGLLSLIMLAILLFRIINKKIDRENIKKYYPLFVFIILISLSLVVRKFWPTMVLEPFMISFINLIMFFTIENPDLKMLEEISKSKDLVEKYNKDKSIFIFNMTQKIKYPLQVIEQRTDELLHIENDNVKEYAADIKYSTSKISTIINKALDLDSMSVNKVKIIDNKYNIKNLLNEIIIISEKEAKNKGL